MKLSDFFRIVRKHIVLIFSAPILMAIIAIVLTRNPAFKYSSETTLYTGFTSTSTVDMDKLSNYFTVNTAFDNLISVIKSRETQQEVGLRLLAQHLMLARENPHFFSEKSYNEITRITPAYVKALVVKNNILLNNSARNNYSPLNSKITAEASIALSIDPAEFEQTVFNLRILMLSSDTNFVYKLLNYNHPHYSIDALSNINVRRLENSDLLKINYESDDPGIAQQTLNIYSSVCIKNYKRIAENKSEAVIKYFDNQLQVAVRNLKIAEDKLLEFNKNNKIINYSEQSKTVANAKENLTIEYNDKKVKLAGVEAVIKRLEEKLGSQRQIQLRNSNLIDKRNQLGDLNYQIAYAETMGSSDTPNDQRLTDLKKEANQLKNEIKLSASQISFSGATTDGLPVATILKDWIDNVLEAENLKASIGVLSERMKEQQKEYSVYGLAGSNIKRIEREITVSEQRYLDILHSLDLAKLKMQDDELSSVIKIFDEPYFPLSPEPTKRKIIVLLAAAMGLMLVLTYIFLLEFFDYTLKNPSNASGILNLPCLAIFPKIIHHTQNINFSYITNRMLEIAVQNIQHYLKNHKPEKKPRTLLFFSTSNDEGKSVVAGNLALKLKRQGEKVLYMDFSRESLRQAELARKGYEAGGEESSPVPVNIVPEKFSILNWLLGYPDQSIDCYSPILKRPESYLSNDEVFSYLIDSNYYSAKSYLDILNSGNDTFKKIPDTVLIVLPAILYYPYPVGLVTDADLTTLICRANRVWSTADQGALDLILKIANQKTFFILNGVEIPVVETVLGVLPKKRNRLLFKAK